MDGLTAREIEVAQLVDKGMTNIEIGDQLGISPRTAKAHVERIKLKIHVRHKRHIPKVLRELGIL